MALGEKDLPEIIGELSAAKSKWYNIGIDLKLEVSTLDGIRNDRKDSTDECFPQMIIAWLRSSSEVPKTWSTLADALKQPLTGFGKLATKIKEEYCRPQIATGEKRQHPGDESETATKQPRLKEGCKCEELKELLLTKDQQIHELISEQNEKLKDLESSMKNRDAQVQAHVKDIEVLRMNKATLKQRCSELKEQVEEHSQQLQQLQQLTTQIQKLQSETSKNETSKQSDSTQQLPSRYGSSLEQDIRQIYATLQTMKDDWYFFGFELNISLKFLDNIKERNKNSRDCLFLVLREWLTRPETQGDKICRWCKISVALMSSLNFPEHRNLVDAIHERWHPYCEPDWLYREHYDPFQS